MACLKIPEPVLPTLPSPLSIPDIGIVPAIDLGVGIDFCCTFRYPLAIPPIGIPLPPVVLTPLVVALALLQDQMTAYLDQLQIPKCPIE